MLGRTLEHEQRLLQAAIDGVVDPIIVVGTDFRVKLMNRAARDYSRSGALPIEELPRCHRLIFGLDVSCERVGRTCPLIRVQEKGGPVRVEHEHVLPDGAVKIFEILASPLLSEEGELLGIVESLRDVTDRQKVTELLRSDQERLEARVRTRTAQLEQAKERAELLYRVSPSAIFTVDRDRRVTSWNDKAEAITGYRREEVLGSIGSRFFRSGGDEGGCCNLLTVPTGRIQGFECQIITRDGRQRLVRLNADVLRDARGEAVGGIGSFEDITEQKRIEEALRTERDKFRIMLSAMGQGMHILNSDFEIEYQNEVLRRQFGDRLGEKCYRVYKQREKPCEFCRMHVAIESGAIQRTEEIMADGRFYEQSYAPFKDVDGRTKALILLRDITEEKAYQAETMRAGQLASIGELAAGVAHEINNPINGIINYAQVLLDEFADAPPAGGLAGQTVQEMLGRIIREGERIAGIVGNLLAFSRQRDERLEEVAMSEVIEDALALIRHQLMKDGIAIRVELPADLPVVAANPQQLQQVFLNLFSNARHALNQRYPGKDPGKRLEISGSNVTVDGHPYVRVTVTDHGTGIAAEIIGNIFDPFFSSKKPGEGTGLGLSISHGIIRECKGLLHVESQPGLFTTMMVDLPAAVPATAQP